MRTYEPYMLGKAKEMEGAIVQTLQIVLQVRVVDAKAKEFAL